VVNASGSMGESSTVATTAVGNSGTATAAYGTLSGFMVQTNTGAVTARSQIEGETAQAGDVIEPAWRPATARACCWSTGRWARGSARTTRPTSPPTAGRPAVRGRNRGRGRHRGGQQYRPDRRQPVGRPGHHRPEQRRGQCHGHQVHRLWQQQPDHHGRHRLGQQPERRQRGHAAGRASHQYNTAYVRAQAEATSYEFGGAQATAYGVGNSAMASNANGPGLVLDNVQVNDGGGVEVIASFEGNRRLRRRRQRHGDRQRGQRLCLQPVQRHDDRHQQPVQQCRRQRPLDGDRGQFRPRRRSWASRPATGNNATFSVTEARATSGFNPVAFQMAQYKKSLEAAEAAAEAAAARAGTPSDPNQAFVNAIISQLNGIVAQTIAQRIANAQNGQAGTIQSGSVTITYINSDGQLSVTITSPTGTTTLVIPAGGV
jgi:hypothetical protein